jgi:hypothetical protein
MTKALLIILSIFLISQEVQAQFVRTGKNVFQDPGRSVKLIVSEREPGIFIVVGAPIDLQLFNPATLSPKDSLHAFIRFDPERNGYSEVLVGSSAYKITGNFSLTLGAVRVGVDNSNPYLSVIAFAHEASKPPSIVGFDGLSVVINYSGQEAVALLEANQLTKFREILSPYSVGESGLFVKQQLVTTGLIGIPTEADNRCLEPQVTLIPSTEIEKIRAAKNADESKKLLAHSLTVRGGREEFNRMLRLRINDDSIIGFDPLDNRIKIVRELRETPGNAAVCSITASRL